MKRFTLRTSKLPIYSEPDREANLRSSGRLYVFVAGGAVFDPEVDDRLAKRLKEKYNPDRRRDQRPSDEALEVSRAVVSFGWAHVGTLPHPV